VKLGSRYGRRAFVLASGAAALVQGARAEPAAADLIPRRLFYSAPERAKVTISPDGGKIAFLAPVDGVQNVWVAPLADPKAGKPVTRIDDRDVLNQLWWPGNDEHVVFCRERAGDENWQTHCVDVESGAVRELSPGPGVKSFVHQVSAHFPGELLIAHNQRDKAYFDIYRVKAATGESTLVFQNDSFAELFTDSQFNVRFGVRYRDGGGWDIVKATGEGAGSVFRSVGIADRYTTALVGASDDGKQLYWLDSKGRDSASVVAQEFPDGPPRTLLENRSADFSEPLFDPIRRTPIAASLVYTKRRWYTLDPGAAPDLDRLQASIDGDISSFGLSNDRANWIVYAEPAAKPGRYFHYQRAERKVVPLFSSRPELDKARLVRLEPVVIPTRGEFRLVSYLSRGVGIEAGQPGALIILVHDGPWTRDTPDFHPAHQWFANRGYNVLSVNFRGSTGLGKKLATAGDGEWGDKMQNDLLDAFEWATNERIAQDTRVAICGSGYGGYAALIGASVTPDRFACAIDLGGMTDLVALADAMAPAWKASLPGIKVRLGGDGSSEEGRKFLAARSPLTYAPRIKCPLLIAHGANNTRVPVAQSDAFVAAMQQRKLPVTYLVYNDEGHTFRRAPNRLSLAAVAEAFLAQNLGGRAEPVGDAFTGSSIEFRAGRELIKGLG
jgi:dipeptidyl aminopeptidase/acylaminoacyl peptidase